MSLELLSMIFKLDFTRNENMKPTVSSVESVSVRNL